MKYLIAIAARSSTFLHPKHPNIIYFMDDDQTDHYKDVNHIAYPRAHLQAKRNFVLDYARSNNIEHLIVCDDDVDYFRTPEKKKIDFISGCEEMIKIAKEEKLTGMMLTQDVFIHWKKDAEKFTNCTKLAWCSYLNVKQTPANIRYDETPKTFEDVDMALQLMHANQSLKTYNWLSAHMISHKSTCFDPENYAKGFLEYMCRLYIKWGDVVSIHQQKRFPKSPYGFRLKLDKFHKWTKKELAQAILDNYTEENVNKFFDKKYVFGQV